MLLLMTFRQLGRDLWKQKLRTAMTAFGIVWGTVAITLLLAFGQALHHQLFVNSAGLGEFIVIAWPSRTSLPFGGIGKGRRVQLTEDDMELIRQRATRGLAGLSGEQSDGLMLNYRDKAVRVDVSGVHPDFGDLRNLVPEAGGRFLNALDWKDRRRVLFLGDRLAREVFGGEDPVGQVVRLHGSAFQVIGVLRHKEQDSSYSGRDEGKAFIPGSTFSALTGYKYLDNFVFKAAAAGQTEPLKNEVIALVAGKHRFDPADKEALAMWDTTEMFQFFTTLMLGFKSFLGVVGILTLIVGGIGVSNIMNVVVEERSREIGIKLALGCRPRMIMLQFLLETLFLTAIGGAIGMSISIGICALVPASVHPFIGVPRVEPWLAGSAAALLGLVGLIAGYFPAREASRLDPVVAMKA